MDEQGQGTSAPHLAQVLDEIAWFRARIREAAHDGRDAVREARAAYSPFLERRIRLLAVLRDRAPAVGHDGARARERASRHGQAERARAGRVAHRTRGPWWGTPQ